jgi:hypothetical protein
MARGRRTDYPTAARIKAMADLGFSRSQISEQSAVHADTCDSIIRGEHGWAEIYDDEVFAEYRISQKRAMQAASTELAKKALVQVEAKLGDSSSLQAATIYGILRDKERLDAGEATANVSVKYSKSEMEDLDQLAKTLAGSLVRDEGS